MFEQWKVVSGGASSPQIINEERTKRTTHEYGIEQISQHSSPGEKQMHDIDEGESIIQIAGYHIPG